MYITDRKLQEIPGLAELDDAGKLQALQDAERIYRHVRRNEFIDETELRAYGERNDLNPDRLNVALGLLQDTGRLMLIPVEQ